MDAADDLTPDFPPTGTFRSSWRPALLRSAAFAGLTFIVLVTLDTVLVAGLDGRVAWILGTLGGAAAAYFPVRYWRRGTARVAFSPDGLRVTPLSGDETFLPRAHVVSVRRRGLPFWWDPSDLVYYHHDDSFRGDEGRGHALYTADERVTLFDLGFDTRDWKRISAALRSWTQELARERKRPATPKAPEAAPVPPRAARPGSKPVVFEPERGFLLPWGLVLFSGLMVGGALSEFGLLGDLPPSSYSRRLPDWVEDSLAYKLGALVFALACVAVSLIALIRTAHRVTLLDRSMVIARYLGPPISVPYADLKGLYGGRLETKRGTFNVGDDNAEVLEHLLRSRLSTRHPAFR